MLPFDVWDIFVCLHSFYKKIISQAKIFTEAVNLTSVALTKLDGSAKGAIILSIAKDLKLPVKLVGIGEKMEDLKDFNTKDFINALFE